MGMCRRNRLQLAAVIVVAVLAGCNAGSQVSPPAAGAGSTTRAGIRSAGAALGPVLTAAGEGTITGWDVDQTEDIGLLSAGYNNGTRLEAFDLKTAKITKLGSFQPGGRGSVTRQYIVLRILANDVALVDDLDLHSKDFQRTDTFPTVSPISRAKVSGRWTPLHRKNLLVDPNEGWVAVNQSTTTNAVMVDQNFIGPRGGIHVYISDIEANTFSPQDRLLPDEELGTPILVAQDTVTSQVIVPMQVFTYPFNPFEAPSFDVDDRKSGKHAIFSPSVGSGSVMGVAIDETTHTMCTTTSEDSDVEFYDLKAKTGFAVEMPGEGGEGFGGGAVAVDETNHLFIVTQPSAPSGGSIVYIYDEKGNVQETITGFNFPNTFSAVLAYVAVNPKLRIGYATGPNADQLQSFSY
ncbi:MAG: hypothetical protein JO113_04945 [Candidatus Eremiobacteraeota bacterium]|nr:hypothetical protein [Candidatus Eremiobacteraeota bacterium]